MTRHKHLGARKLRDLTATDIDRWLAAKSKILSTRTLRLLHSILNRSINRAMARDKVMLGASASPTSIPPVARAASLRGWTLGRVHPIHRGASAAEAPRGRTSESRPGESGAGLHTGGPAGRFIAELNRKTASGRAVPGPGPENRRMYVIRERFFSIGDDFDVLDEHGTKLFHVDGKVLSARNKVVIEDLNGQELASVHRHLVALRPTYEIRIGGETAAEVKKKLFTPFREKFTIDVPGPDDLEMSGDLLDHEYTIERGGTEVAAVSKRWLTIRDTYAVQVAAGEDPLLIVASVLALDLALDREAKKREEKREDND